MEDSTQTASKLDLAYILLKYIFAANEDEVLPGCTGFNTMLYSREITHVSRVGYLPVITTNRIFHYQHNPFKKQRHR